MRKLGFRLLLAAVLALAQLVAAQAHRPAFAAAGWAEICTADGLRRVPAGDEPAPPQHGDDHCLLCRIAEPMAGAVAFDRASAQPPPAEAATLAEAAPAPRRSTPHDAPARAPPARA